MPAMPQPTPNSALPASKRRSARPAAGICSGSPNRLRSRRRAHKKAGAATAIAPTITSASEGSHWPVTSRNANTLAGLAMPATISPRPKITPLSSANRI